MINIPRHTSLQPSFDTSGIEASLFGNTGTTKFTAPLPTPQKRSKRMFWTPRSLKPTNIPTSSPKTTAVSCSPNPSQTASKLVTPPKYNGSLCTLSASMHPIHQSTNHLPLHAMYTIRFALSPQSCTTSPPLLYHHHPPPHYPHPCHAHKQPVNDMAQSYLVEAV